jgi:hypothetical protein
MAVVINEFEMMPGQPPQPEQDRAPREGAPGMKSQMSTHEIENILERQRQRFERVRAD